MKKMILTALAALLLAVPAVQAQKVNKAAILAKIEKSDSDVADAKKAAKAATWLNRGKIFYEAAIEPTKNLFVNMDGAMLKLTVGEPVSVDKIKVADVEYTTWIYPYFTAYIKDNKIVTWKETQKVFDAAVVKAIEAYNKAYELDPKVADKAKEGLKQISDFCSQIGNTGIDTGDYAVAADAYVTAFAAQSSPAYANAEPVLLYYAGYLRTIDGATNPASFPMGVEYLSKALDLGYADEEGNIYYYLFHCYYGQKAADEANVLKAKDALLAGINKFPKNERILDGLMQLYTTEKGVGDPADLVALIDEAIKNNPENTDLLFGRARIFYALKNYDEGIVSLTKVVEMKPDQFDGNYYLGVFYASKGDVLNADMNTKQYSSQAAYDADLKSVNDVYLAAVTPLEKAYQIKPESMDTLELLKQLCFRLRDEPGIKEKYETYNALYKQVKGIE
ncbi:MAG: hypothetical protein RRY33_01270 [Alistipes sp.]